MFRCSSDSAAELLKSISSRRGSLRDAATASQRRGPRRMSKPWHECRSCHRGGRWGKRVQGRESDFLTCTLSKFPRLPEGQGSAPAHRERRAATDRLKLFLALAAAARLASASQPPGNPPLRTDHTYATCQRIDPVSARHGPRAKEDDVAAVGRARRRHCRDHRRAKVHGKGVEP
jgi:hypothetical protein